MKYSFVFASAALAVQSFSASPSTAATPVYALKRTHDASNFASSFSFYKSAINGDPTNGFVNYVDHSTAVSEGLYRVLKGTGDQGHDQVRLGVDNTTVLSAKSSAGRDSLRLESLATFDTGLLIADIAHMPGNQCGVWPALWTYNFAETPIGEIDIIEGINHQTDNIISLHTCDSCKFTAGSSKSSYGSGASMDATHPSASSNIMTGRDMRSNCAMGGDCDNDIDNGDGCGVTAAPESASYGDAFNAAGGGVYVLQVEASSSSSSLSVDDSRQDKTGFVRIWNFARDNIPQDITAGSPNPDLWGLPTGAFEQKNGGCNVGRLFRNQTIIINIDFCGDEESDDTWQGDSACSKYSSCPSFVASNPHMFSEIYWLFNSIKVYQRS